MTMNKQKRRLRIKYKIRKKLSGTAERPRLSIYKSNTAMYVQIIDDQVASTLVSASSQKAPKAKKTSYNIQDCIALGKQVAEKAKEKGINSIVFDRNGYQYHGKVKALADSIRENGLTF